MKVLLFPFVIEQVVMALDTVQADAQKSARDPASQFRSGRVLRFLVLVDGDRDEIDFRLRRPDSGRIDEAANKLIVRTILMELFGEPINQSMTPINQEWSVLDADVGPREPFSEVIAVPPIFEDVAEPPLNRFLVFLGFKLANFFERGQGASQAQRNSAGDRANRRGGSP